MIAEVVVGSIHSPRFMLPLKPVSSHLASRRRDLRSHFSGFRESVYGSTRQLSQGWYGLIVYSFHLTEAGALEMKTASLE